MPVAALAESEYFPGTFCGCSRISVSDGSDDEHSPSALRHSEETAVENPPSHAVPEVGQRSKQLSEVPTAVRGEEPGYVLDEKPAGSKRVGDPGELEEEAGASSGEASPLAGDAEVLAGEPSAEEVDAWKISGAESPLFVRPDCALSGGAISDGWPLPFLATRLSNTSVLPSSFASCAASVAARSSWPHQPTPELANVVVDGDAGEPGAEDCPSEGVLLAEERVVPPGPAEALVESSDP